ncbi:MAG: hypothetical protein WD894_10380 [Pirellulales bacterium]
MAIEARCPNGHKIVCPEDRAGRTARCPKCSAPFRIPEPPPNGRPQPAAAPLANSDDDLATTAAVLAGGSSPSAVSAAQAGADPGTPKPGEETFLFLCPNGHKLHGPTRLAGKVGKCPHCRAKFEIPVPHQEEDEDEPDGLDDTVTEDPLHDYGDEGPSDGSAELLADGPQFEPAERDEGSDAFSDLQSRSHSLPSDTGSSVLGRSAHSSDKGNPLRETPAPQTPVPPPLPMISSSLPAEHGAAHPFAELVARLWAEREHGGIVELHLSGGALLAPEWFDEPSSRGGYGLFASQAADGTVTMTVVPWSEVTRIVVRGVVGLPDGMFE